MIMWKLQMILRRSFHEFFCLYLNFKHNFWWYIKITHVTFMCPWTHTCQKSPGHIGWTIVTFQVIWNKNAAKTIVFYPLGYDQTQVFSEIRKFTKWQVFEKKNFLHFFCVNNSCKNILDQNFQKSLCLFIVTYFLKIKTENSTW